MSIDSLSASSAVLNNTMPLCDFEIPYDRSSVQVGIVHIGAGRFHRAHEALYCHELLALGDLSWGISAAYILPSDRDGVAAMRAQDGLYTLFERDASGETVKVIGSIVEVLYGVESPESVIDRLAHPDVKVVTFTVTEAGYYFEPATKGLLLEHPAVENDILAKNAPQTLYGYLAAGLARRRAKGLAPFTIQSCDNIQGNGDLVCALFREFLLAWDAKQNSDLADWVLEKVTFPNSMVDRITPAADKKEQAHAFDTIKCEDRLAVTSESYRQWVIEDKFCNGRPLWEKVGAEFVASVKGHEQVKIRLLNAGHSAVGYSGYLAGFETIGDIVSHDLFQAYLLRFFAQVEITLPAVSSVNIEHYKHKLIQRFTNPAIVDQALRICKDGSAKLPGFIVPTLTELLAQGASTDTFAFLLASYAIFLERQLEEKGVAGIDDPERERLADLVQQAQGDMRIFLSDESFFGRVCDHQAFLDLCQGLADQIRTKGILSAIPVGK